MAQYSNLKAYIEEKIYENGTQAITGDILQDVLKVMTDDLGEFYQTGGMASPSTDPGTPDAKVIYFATEAGTYTNFGGITLAAGEVALLIFETSWTKVELNVLSSANGGVKTANLADGAVTTEKIAGGAVETAKIADNAVTSGKVADGAIGTAKIADGAIDADKIAANAVESAKIKNGAVTQGKINDGAVTAGKIASNAVTTDKIKDDAVTSDKIANYAVGSVQLASGAVHAGNIADGAVTAPKIGGGAVTSGKIGSGAVTEEKIADGAVTTSKIANGAVGSDQLAEGAFSAQNLADGSVTTDKLADEAVTAEKIADGAVTAGKFANGSVTTIKLGSGAVTTEKIGDGMVTRQKLADSSVGTSKIIDGAVTTAKVADANVTTAKIADANVTTGKLADGAVTTAKIADGNVTGAKLQEGVRPVINVNALNEQTSAYGSAALARAAVPSSLRILGLHIIYLLAGGWFEDEYIGSDVSGWGTASNWRAAGPVSVSQNSETGHTNINIGNNSYPVASTKDVERTDFNFDASLSKQIPMELGYIACGGNVGSIVNLTPVSHSTYKHGIVDCKQGDVFYVQGKGGNSDRLYCFIDSNNAIIKSAAPGDNFKTPIIVFAPANSAKLIVNDEASGLPSWYGEKALVGISKTLYHIEDLVFNTDVEFIIDQQGKYYNIDKQLVTASSFNVAKVNVTETDSIFLSARAGVLSCSYWEDTDGNLIFAFIGNPNDGINIKLALSVPTYAKYLYVSYVALDGLVVRTYGNKNIFNEIDKLSERVNAELLYNSTVDGYYLDVNGEEQASSTLAIDKYDIIFASKIHIRARIGGIMYIIFYDNNDNILTKYAGNSEEGVNVNTDYDVPVNASYVRVSYSKEFTHEISLASVSLQSQIDEINKTIGGDIEYDSVINGKFLDVNGDEQTLSSYKIYKYLFNGELEKIHLKVRMGEAAYTKFYDASDNIVGSIQGNSQEGLNIDSDYDVPNGATYIRISSSNEAICEITPVGDGILQTLEYIKQVINGVDTQWNGKKIGLLGDSIAAGSAASSIADRFINVAATYLGASVKNAAIGGWYLGDEEGKSIYRQVNGVSPATTSLDGDEDLVVIFAGTNDFGHAFTIGNAYTEVTSGGATRKVPSIIDTETCGGLVKTIQTLYTKYGGYIPIVICTPIQRYASGGDSQETGHAPLGPWAKNSAGKYLDDYIEGIKSVATLYGIPVFDCYHNNMNPNIAAACTKYFGTTSNPSGDGLHPNDAGHELLGKQLAYFLKTHFFDV